MPADAIVATLRVGSLAGVDPDTRLFPFEPVPAECFCAECKAIFTAADGCCECPTCGTISRELGQGRELLLLSLQLA
ncbi:hypothetical protein KBY66_07455 [Synechococcus sp. Tobar12-5m-g]|uniref:hydrogenase maturation nickel metallochaperone HypA n=1 Tax=Synechococcus sp. Cruz CV-v-12 TaxID=2823728 RepID=UPI0020CF5A22|nr:hydrogenase maturation nickel metallochaperone HypA [Synechococcus sp. Cruz CV-v-12]MCP9772461.1 hypothetical protein [Synechococcus sp. Tobar12-5m-g]MCP9874289.1 hypothetical protein [Synechococcus sp. Cruz CV-v-12]